VPARLAGGKIGANVKTYYSETLIEGPDEGDLDYLTAD
jgi:hypothetical protein